MNHPEKHFLKQILSEQQDPEFCTASLENMLSVARQRRRRRKAARVVFWTVFPVFTLVVTFWRLAPPVAQQPGLMPNPPLHSTPPPSAIAQAETSPIHYLSDEELLSLFPGRRVALIGQADAQKLVFLDGKAQR